MLEVPTEVTCPHCGEPITVFVDLSVESQSYIEDCSVCCRPMNVSYQSQDGELADIRVDAAD
jgi:transcription elongation factor Elf1